MGKTLPLPLIFDESFLDLEIEYFFLDILEIINMLLSHYFLAWNRFSNHFLIIDLVDLIHSVDWDSNPRQCSVLFFSGRSCSEERPHGIGQALVRGQRTDPRFLALSRSHGFRGNAGVPYKTGSNQCQTGNEPDQTGNGSYWSGNARRRAWTIWIRSYRNWRFHSGKCFEQFCKSPALKNIFLNISKTIYTKRFCKKPLFETRCTLQVSFNRKWIFLNIFRFYLLTFCFSLRVVWIISSNIVQIKTGWIITICFKYFFQVHSYDDVAVDDEDNKKPVNFFNILFYI